MDLQKFKSEKMEIIKLINEYIEINKDINLQLRITINTEFFFKQIE